MIRHLILLRFKDDVSQSMRLELESAFAALKQRIPGIEALEWGINISPEVMNKGFTHCFLLTFDNLENRDVYLPHPAHQEFVTQLTPWIADVLVIDYAPSIEFSDEKESL